MKGFTPNDIIMTGSSSMVGSRVAELIENDFSLFKTDINLDNMLDITNKEQVDNLILDSNPKVPILHFAAYTNVDEAESERGKTDGVVWKINVEGTRNIVSACQKENKKILYISTDFVFDGKNGPYAENDQTVKSMDEISWYGWTKLQAEHEIQSANVPYLIIRIAYPFRAKFEKKLDFVRNIIVRMENKTLYPLFNDQYLTPTFVDDLSDAIKVLIKSDATGIYHVATPDTVTPYEVALKIAEVFGYDKSTIQKGSLDEFKKHNNILAKRPKFGGLKSEKISSLVKLHTLDESLVMIKNQMEALH